MKSKISMKAQVAPPSLEIHQLERLRQARPPIESPRRAENPRAFRTDLVQDFESQ